MKHFIQMGVVSSKITMPHRESTRSHWIFNRWQNDVIDMLSPSWSPDLNLVYYLRENLHPHFKISQSSFWKNTPAAEPHGLWTFLVWHVKWGACKDGAVVGSHPQNTDPQILHKNARKVNAFKRQHKIAKMLCENRHLFFRSLIMNIMYFPNALKIKIKVSGWNWENFRKKTQ